MANRAAIEYRMRRATLSEIVEEVALLEDVATAAQIWSRASRRQREAARITLLEVLTRLPVREEQQDATDTTG